MGLLAALFYGAGDFCGGFAAKRSGVLAVTLGSQAVGFVLLAAVLPLSRGTLTHESILYGSIAGVCGGVGIALLYHALSIGRMGVVSPITAVLAAMLPVIAGELRGERLSVWQFAGIALALAAVVLISLSTEPDGRLEFSTVGVREAAASGIALGGFYIFLSLAGKGAGLYPLLFARSGSVLILLTIALLLRTQLVPATATAAIVFVGGLLDMSANVLYVFAAYAGYLSIAAVLTSLYPASTVILARLVLRERLGRAQQLGLVFALAGVALIAA